MTTRVGLRIAIIGLGLFVWAMGGLAESVYAQGVGTGILLGTGLYWLLSALLPPGSEVSEKESRKR